MLKEVVNIREHEGDYFGILYEASLKCHSCVWAMNEKTAFYYSRKDNWGDDFYILGKPIDIDNSLPSGIIYLYSDDDDSPLPRAKLLRDAEKLVVGERNNQYGPPTQDFQRTADMLNAQGYRGPNGRLLLSHDIAIIMMNLKLSRLVWGYDKEDTWIDTAGYAACGWECANDKKSVTD